MVVIGIGRSHYTSEQCQSRSRMYYILYAVYQIWPV